MVIRIWCVFTSEFVQEPNLTVSQHPKVIDAIRISDKRTVAVKRTREGSKELMIAKFLNCEELLKDPHNHTVPILDVFKKDGESLTFMVMPFLSAFDEPTFSSVDEVIDFMRQTLEVCLV